MLVIVYIMGLVTGASAAVVVMKQKVIEAKRSEKEAWEMATAMVSNMMTGSPKVTVLRKYKNVDQPSDQNLN